MKIYHYDKETKEYLSNSIARLDPIESLPMLPANASKIAPLVIATGVKKANMFDEVLNKWVLVDDNRGWQGFDVQGLPKSIDKINIAIDPSWSVNKLFSLTKAKVTKLTEIVNAYKTANSLDINFSNTTFQTDKDSKLLLAEVLSAGSVPTNFYWVDSLNNKVNMTYTKLRNFSKTILTRNQLNFDKYQNYKALVKNLPTTATQADLDSIVITF